MSLKINKFFDGSVLLIENNKYEDSRGFFSEIYNKEILNKSNIRVEFVQDNFSFSKQKGIIRGLHFQSPPFAQSKLIQVIKGKILDVVVDLRNKSNTYGDHKQFEISGNNFHQLFISEGFAHGFATLEENTEVIYKVSNYYVPKSEQTIYFADKTLGIDWKINAQNAIVSDKDKKGVSFNELQSPF